MCYRRARGGAPLTPRADRETGASPWPGGSRCARDKPSAQHLLLLSKSHSRVRAAEDLAG